MSALPLSIIETRRTQVVKRHAKKADRLIEVLFNRAMHDDRAYRLYKKLTEGQDTPEVRSAVDRYQSALLMPAWLMREAASRHDLLRWDGLYRLKVEAGVTISKTDIMKSFDQPRGAERAQSDYDADQITVHQYGDAAIVNFRLIAKPRPPQSQAGDWTQTVQYYRNTGTFVRRNGHWQAVAWQSTKAAAEAAAQ